jgi:hypothetical protein
MHRSANDGPSASKTPPHGSMKRVDFVAKEVLLNFSSPSFSSSFSVTD